MQRDEYAGERGWRFETYEERLALSAEPLADFWYDIAPHAAIEPSSELVYPLAQAAAGEGHGWTDIANVREQFGLSGANQTVAVIDSGIAYDHVALGSGLGKAYRVVGGWDFAENDANPYDDGPAGFHGTHVAGIVGADDDRYAGVAPEVDLVALRVFDDQGGGQFTWVEQALQWVHTNRNAFENPITTVNISLGTEWNARSLPKWATLEDELSQLASDGIFISVAAGNSFLIYHAAGLSYPAVSPHVTPVASTDAGGNLSRFTQRSERVLAAPGERIMSTLPDHFYGGDGLKDDWGATSGSSMAAPYVAGASALVREAMRELGVTSITQGTIYDLFRRTADGVFDAATNANHRRLNLTRALETLVGADDYGSSAAAAGSLGRLTTSLQISGTIGRVSDQDFFQFTAGATGKATLTLARSASEGIIWSHAGGAGRVQGEVLSLDVVAGQTYVVGVASGDGSIGKYAIGLQLSPASGGNGGGNGTTSGGGSGTSGPSVVTITGSTATIVGTAAADTIAWHAASPQTITVNGSDYSLAGVTQIRIDAGGGSDTLTLVGGSAAETVRLRPGSAELAGGGISLVAANIERAQFHGGAGDHAWLYDSAANDHLEASPAFARLVGGGYENYAAGCGAVTVIATAGGRDTASLKDSAGVDLLDACPSYVWLRGAGYSIRAEGFDDITVLATAGTGDLAGFYGSAGNDFLSIWGSSRSLYAGGVQFRTDGFAAVYFDGAGGWDQVDFYTNSGRSRLRGRDDRATLADGAFTTELAGAESLLASVRRNHRLQTDLKAIDFVFRKIGLA